MVRKIREVNPPWLKHDGKRSGNLSERVELRGGGKKPVEFAADSAKGQQLLFLG
jgi:hypothetical protein